MQCFEYFEQVRYMLPVSSFWVLGNGSVRSATRAGNQML
jgi:hypothetical protein